MTGPDGKGDVAKKLAWGRAWQGRSHNFGRMTFGLADAERKAAA
jgi:hypothetical protein